MPPTGSITQEQVDFVETWENVSPITNYVIKLDVRGDETHVEISGRRQFMLTTQERLLTESKILDKKNNPFTNGCFRPIITPENITIETNPNALSDDEILNIFKASEIAWTEWLANIDAPATVRRMMDLADDAEDISLKRYRQLEARLTEVTGGPRHATQKDEDTYRRMAGEEGPSSGKAKRKAAMTSGGSTATS